MLKQARQHTKTIIWVVVACFILWGAGSFVAGLHELASAAGEVFGHKISLREFDRAYHHAGFTARQSQGQVLPELLTSEAWQQILLAERARREGLTVSDQEVIERIQSLLPDRQKLPPNFYENWTRNTYRASARDFEESIRSELLIQKLISRVKQKVTLSEEEAFRMYRRDRMHFKAMYVDFGKDEKDKADAFYEEAKKNNRTLPEAVKEARRKLKATAYFTREGELEGLVNPWFLSSELAKLRARRPTRPLTLETGYGIFAKRSVFKPSKAQFDKVKARVSEELKKSKETTALMEFLQTARQEADLKMFLEPGRTR